MSHMQRLKSLIFRTEEPPNTVSQEIQVIYQFYSLSSLAIYPKYRSQCLYLFILIYQNYKCQLRMDTSNISRTSTQRKTSYFQKYRKELDRISDEMKYKNHSSNSFSQKSDSVKESKVMNTEPKMIKSHHVPTIQTSVKKSHIFQSQKESARKQSIQSKEDIEQNIRENQATKEVEMLMEQLEAAKSKIQQSQAQISQKRITIQYLKKQITIESSENNNQQIINYAEKILAIEARMKFKKELHQDQLNRIVNEKNVKHSENVQLSKFIEHLQDQLNSLSQQYEKSQKQQSINSLKQQAAKIEFEVAQLTHQCAQIQQKINNSEELKGISLNEYKRYSEVYKRHMIGKQIAQTEQRIKQRNNQKRYLIDMQRKKWLIKQKKVQNQVRQKSVIQVERVIKFVNKQIEQLKKQLVVLNYQNKSNHE